jgi:hypothetical protein
MSPREALIESLQGRQFFYITFFLLVVLQFPIKRNSNNIHMILIVCFEVSEIVGSKRWNLGSSGNAFLT